MYACIDNGVSVCYVVTILEALVDIVLVTTVSFNKVSDCRTDLAAGKLISHIC